MWLDWLRDEVKLALTEEEKKKTELLFERATKDYLSNETSIYVCSLKCLFKPILFLGIDIWVEYIQFSLAGMGIGGTGALKQIRGVMEEAIRHGGLHLVKGALLWDSYRDFEMAIYQTTKGGNAAENLSQAQQITQLFNRQLSVPLLDMVRFHRFLPLIIALIMQIAQERTWNEYNEWLQLLDQKIEPHVKISYEKAKAQMGKMSPLEDTMLIAVENSDKAAVYRTYLDLEVNEFKDPARIQALFERIVADIPLYDVFWNEYCKFVDRQFKNAETTFSLFNRAIRNCPWNGPIWADYIFAAERYQKEHGFISGRDSKFNDLLFILLKSFSKLIFRTGRESLQRRVSFCGRLFGRLEEFY